ncbi:hypothetical protein [Pseudanabaena sp. FACHB-2040]|uniref:hypothetical protein n=1 Tax=Pseudanabaena sp. FACHB-2040 TaxID=2692859 RepID=UPI001686C7CD|nr:hypothetical protein [Pseudanabaena sp. FACHB-2040]MBD2261051.1 hypothetical protein [Pseudanabaena sp. FACHB-2040]
MSNTNTEINQALAVIEEWITKLEKSRLSEVCRVEGRDFFQFMESRGVARAFMAKLIIQVTGQSPATLYRVEDAELLKDAIFRYAGSVVTTQIEEKHGISGTARRNVKHFWVDEEE